VLTRVVDQDAPHHLRGDAEELRAALPGDAVLTGESEVRFVDQRGGLQRMVRPFMAKVRRGSPSQFTIDQWEQAVARLEISATPRAQ
jgi:hypothetical protein